VPDPVPTLVPIHDVVVIVMIVVVIHAGPIQISDCTRVPKCFAIRVKWHIVDADAQRN